jgi:hypothetical protein
VGSPLTHRDEQRLAGFETELEVFWIDHLIRPFVPFTKIPFLSISCSMDNLITVVTRFQLPPGLTAGQIHAAFDEAAPGFRNVPGLVRKQFLRSKDCRVAGGVYLWNDEQAARAFMNDRVAPMIREKFHVDPTIEFYDSPMMVEN